ncbi:MAG TPA: SufD family Fe-S cluster assembly protein, partial [Candidatus Angelobacter sp.]|nr:SufD family Fe-S cluster assembly protein [Candidatus Angelobacter sp.]
MKKSAIIDAVAVGLAKPVVPLGYSTEFGDFSQRLKDQASWLIALRREGYTQFAETGFPTTHDEDWRFTNVSAVAQTKFALADGEVQPLSTGDLEPFGVSEFACCLVFVNGKFSRRLSRVPALPKGVEISSLAEGITSHPAAVEGYLGRHLDFYRDAFAALNTAFIEDGAYVYIPRSTVVEQPIYLLYISTPDATPTMTHPRNLIIVEENSQATIAEDYVSLGSTAAPGCGTPALSNTVTELVVGESAVVSHTMIVRESEQTYNFSTLRIQQARSSNVASHSLLLSGALVRNNVHPVLAGEGAECLINGLFMANGRQHMDNYMLVEHASPHCSSRQFYNGILNGQAHGVFHGRIIVHKDA